MAIRFRSPSLPTLLLLVSSATAQGHRLNDELAREPGVAGDVLDFQVSPTGERAVYRADGDSDSRIELYSVPIDRSTSPRKLNGSMPPSIYYDGVGSFKFTFDGSRVVYLAPEDTTFVMELYSVPVDGSAPGLKLNTPITTGDVLDFAISANSTRVVYLAGPSGREELYSVPLGGGTVVRLNPTLVSGGRVHDFMLDPAGTRVVYRANQDTEAEVELFSTPIAGGAVVQLNGPLVSGGDVGRLSTYPSWRTYDVSPDGTRVIYVADQTVDERLELFSVPITGGVPVRLNGTFTPGGSLAPYWNLYRNFQISADSARVVYLADQAIDGRPELWSVPIAGGAALRLNSLLDASEYVSRFECAPDGRVLYLSNEATGPSFERQLWLVPLVGGVPPVRLSLPGQNLLDDVPFEVAPTFVAYRPYPWTSGLYGVPLDGSSTALRLDAGAPAFAEVQQIQLTGDGQHVLFTSDRGTDGTFELFRAPLDGHDAPLRLNASLPPGGAVGFEFGTTPDGASVLYVADQLVDNVDELFRVPADASAEPVRLNDPLALGPVVGDVARFTLDARGRIVLFEANLDDIDRRELVSVSLQSLGPARRVNASNAGSQGVRGHRLTTDGERVVYRADQDAPLRFELFSAPADASATPLRLNPPLAADRQVLEDFQLGAGDRVLYRADQELDELYELYAVPVTGGSALKLSDPILGNVQSFLVSGGRAIHQTSLGLYSVPIDGSLPPLRLDDPLVSAGTLFDYQSSEDDAWIVYRLQPTSPSRPWKIFSVPAAGGPVNPLQTQEVHSVIQYSFSPDGSAVAFLGLSANVQQLYSVPVTGGVPLLLNGPLIAGGGVREFRWTPDGAHLLYRADQEVAGRNELYAVPADASSQPYKLNQTLVAGGQVLSFELSPDGARAVYRADASVDNRIELFSVPIDASQAPVRLNGPMGPNGDVFAVQVLPDSATVLYVSDEVFNVKNELWRMPIDGSTAPVRVSGALLQGSQVRSFRSAAGLVVYLADQDELDVVEIYLSYLTPPRRRR